MTKNNVLWFQQQVLNWYQQKGRKNLPWQIPIDPYRVWISEIMLQQTQVETVIPYFEKFLKQFPDIQTLSKAELDQVLHLWSGLGYYARARNLYKTANILVTQHQAQLPQALDELIQLPGIGRSTAGAILSLGFNHSAAILDGNVKRVLCRYFCIAGWPGKTSVQKQLWQLVEKLTPYNGARPFNQAMMDIGSLICKRSKPNCSECPLSKKCLSFNQSCIHIYPTKKPGKEMLIKKKVFLLIQNEQHHFLLIKRPPSGIWGAMWCFPEPMDLEAGNVPYQQIALTHSFQHQFSHFKMDASLYTATLTQHNMISDSQRIIWYDPLKPETIGLPTPISIQLNKLIETIIK